MITIKDIAKKCNISPSTVSKVIKDYSTIPEETKIRVRKVMEELGYVPNAAASSLSSGQYTNIGILGFLNDKQSPLSRNIFSNILASFQNAASEQGFDLIFIDKHVRGQKVSFLRSCENKMLAGVLLFGNLYDKQMQEVMNSDIPCVGFDYFDENVNSVFTDGKKALYELTKYIISNGHKNIIFVAGDPNDMTKTRIDGFKEAMEEANLPLHDYSVTNIAYGNIDEVEQISERIIKEHPEVTAIIYPDDMTAQAGIHKLRELGKKVPSDISVAGFDGAPWAKYLTHPLTTMKQNTKLIGKSLAELLISIIKNPNQEKQSIGLEAELIKGKTVAKI